VLGQEMLPWAFMALMLVMAGFLLFRSHRYFTQQRSNRSPWTSHGRDAVSRPAHPLGDPPEAVNWEVQMHDFARQMKGELDSKMSALQALIAEADRAAARLEQALQNSPTGGNFLPTSQADALHSASSSPPQRREEIYALADYGLPPNEIAHRTGTPIGEVELMLNLREKK
jgi:DNA-directed RNA polymerase specialized sigma24 family protein